MALQFFDQTNPRLGMLVKNLQELGQGYLAKHPDSTKGKFTLFPHTNQPIAQCLKNLDISTHNSAVELMETLRCLFKKFSNTGSLLKDVYRSVLNSGLYPDVVIQTQKIKTKKNEDQRNDDGGGYNPKWQLRDYQQALKPVSTNEFPVATVVSSTSSATQIVPVVEARLF